MHSPLNRKRKLLARLALPLLYACAAALFLPSCGAAVDDLRMCQKLEDGACPTGLDMFLIKHRTFYLSGESSVDAGENISVSLEDISDPDEPREVYTSDFVQPEDQELITIPVKSGRLKAGSYQILLKDPEDALINGMKFSVWNTQAEIDARKALGDEYGAVLSDLRICKEPVDNTCEESFHTIPHGTRELHISFTHNDTLDDSKLKLVWKRNGKRISSTDREISSAGTIWAMVGYENQSMPRGNYTAEIIVDKSKQGRVLKKVKVQ
ncbi:MAG: hypothetical protein NXI24_01525 [bacterium]|nr:hypothetical protein [bacterium]